LVLFAQILNIGDVATWMNEEVREEDGFLTRAILCMPILNGQKTVIGVAQLINKVGVFVIRSKLCFLLVELITSVCSRERVILLRMLTSQLSKRSQFFVDSEFTIPRCMKMHVSFNSKHSEKLSA